jgi:ectoine hydroxylase-related dioxygenase (phytanoyl-CoA dioxygenase family)
VLAGLRAHGALDEAAMANAVAACAEGYAFPTDLDRDPPIGGLAPPSQQDLMTQALREAWPMERFESAVTAQTQRRAG